MKKILLLLLLGTTFCLSQFVRTEKFRNEHERRMRYEYDDWISYAPTVHFSNIVAGPRYLYFGTLGGGILRYHLYDNYWDYPYTTSNGLPSNRIRGVIFDEKTSRLIAITPEDIAYLDPSAKEWKWKSKSPFWPYEQLPKIPGKTDWSDKKFQGREAIMSLPTYFANDEYSIIHDWLLMDRNFEEFPVTGFFVDRFDRIWFTVDGFGLGLGQTASQRADFFRVGLPIVRPRAMAFQGDDLWFGGHARRNRDNLRGVALWPIEGNAWKHFQSRWISRFQDDNVNAIVADENHVWFGTEYGVARYDRGENTWKPFDLGDGVVSNTIVDMLMYKGYLYIGTDQGISRIHPPSGVVEPFKDSRFSRTRFNRLAADDSSLWAATSRGIYRLRDKDWEHIDSKAAINNLRITAVAANRAEVWFATDDGIMKLDKETNQWESFPAVGMEIDGRISDLKVDGKAVWAATASGLLKYNRAQKNWRLFTEVDGLLDNRCHRIVIDRAYIWVVTDAGISQFFGHNPNRFD